jgi:two-component system chemotaxis response regulator CheB
MIRVLVVEDSATVREFLLCILRSDTEIEVVGTAETGEEAIEAVERTRPDVITMDVHMPKMNGFDATRQIMETHPTPIVIVSGTTDVTDTTKAFRAIEVGALALLQRPNGMGHPEHERTAADLVRTVKLMSEVKVVRRWPRVRPGESLAVGASASETALRASQPQIRLVAMGASTGGPPVLQTILSGLPPDFHVPVLVVQHIAAGFTQGFVEWLAQSSSLPVQVPQHGETVLPGRVYVAPEGFHMAVGTDQRVLLNTDPPENGLRPSVSCLFRSVAKAYGQAAIGVLLTGMGKDGALGMKLMHERGAVTFAQDQGSSIVHGMAGEAIRIGAATYVLSPEKICMAVIGLVTKNAGVVQRSQREIEGIDPFLRSGLSGS